MDICCYGYLSSLKYLLEEKSFTIRYTLIFRYIFLPEQPLFISCVGFFLSFLVCLNCFYFCSSRVRLPIAGSLGADFVYLEVMYTDFGITSYRLVLETPFIKFCFYSWKRKYKYWGWIIVVKSVIVFIPNTYYFSGVACGSVTAGAADEIFPFLLFEIKS